MMSLHVSLTTPLKASHDNKHIFKTTQKPQNNQQNFIKKQSFQIPNSNNQNLNVSDNSKFYENTQNFIKKQSLQKNQFLPIQTSKNQNLKLVENSKFYSKTQNSQIDQQNFIKNQSLSIPNSKNESLELIESRKINSRTQNLQIDHFLSENDSFKLLENSKNYSRTQNFQIDQQNFIKNQSLSENQNLKLLELSFIRNKARKFPGSVENENDVFKTFSMSNFDDEEEMLVKAVEIRRNVAKEILKEAMMKKGKFGITYCENVVGLLGDFVDYVMIRGVEMKGVEKYEDLNFNDRVKEFVDQCNVVPLIRWLKHNSLSYPQIAKLICMSKGNLEAIWEVAEWIKSVNVKGRFIGVSFMKAGEKVLHKSVEELDEIVHFLETNGVRRDWMGYVISRSPQLLAYSMDELKSRVNFYLNMGMNANDFGTMVFDYPQVLGYFSMEEMNQKVAYLMEFGLDNEQVGKLLAFKPQLMGCSIEDRWKPLVKYLYYLGIPKEGIRRILTIKPMIFCVDLETTIVPKVQFLRDIGVREDAIGNMLVKFPPLLTYSLYKKIRPVVIFLLTKAGVTQKDIGKVIGLAPELLGCSIAHKLDGNVKYFLSLGISLRVLGQMIADFPMLLRYNTDLHRPKYRYLRRIMIRPLKDVIEFPRFFSYSLEERIAPRHKILVENRVNFKLRYMLAGTDEDFRNRVKAAVERRERFEAGVVEEYSSDSQTSSFVDENSDDFNLNYSSYSDTTSTDECSDSEIVSDSE